MVIKKIDAVYNRDKGKWAWFSNGGTATWGRLVGFHVDGDKETWRREGDAVGYLTCEVEVEDESPRWRTTSIETLKDDLGCPCRAGLIYGILYGVEIFEEKPRWKLWYVKDGFRVHFKSEICEAPMNDQATEIANQAIFHGNQDPVPQKTISVPKRSIQWRALVKGKEYIFKHGKTELSGVYSGHQNEDGWYGLLHSTGYVSYWPEMHEIPGVQYLEWAIWKFC